MRSINNYSNNLICRKFDTDYEFILLNSKNLSQLYGISYHFSEILTEAALGRNICKYWY